MHLNYYQYFKAALVLCVLLWSQEGGQHGYTFLLTIVSNMTSIFSETYDYTWNQMGWKLSELSFPNYLEWFSFKANTFLFQSTWKCSFLCLILPHSFVTEDLQWLMSLKARRNDGSLWWNVKKIQFFNFLIDMLYWCQDCAYRAWYWSITARTHVSLLSLGWAFNGWRGTQDKNEIQIMEVPWEPKDSRWL